MPKLPRVIPHQTLQLALGAVHVAESEVLRVRVFFDDGTSAYIPFMAVGRRIIRFEVNEWIYAPMLRHDFDDLDALE